MVVRRPKRRVRYAPLANNYYMDPAIISVGLQAEVVYVRSLAFSASSGLDGFLLDEHVRYLCRGVRGIRRTCAALTSANLWVRDEVRGGYWVRSWRKWNPSEAEISAGQDAEERRARRPGRAAKSDVRATYPIERNPLKCDAVAEAVQSNKGDGPAPPGPGRSVAPPPDLSELRQRLAEAAHARRTRTAKEKERP